MNIYIYDGKTEIPDETCYVIAKGGIYLKKKLDLIESLTPVDKISFLENLPSFAKLNIPKLSTKVFGSILGFFKKIYSLQKTEVMTLIYYNKSKKRFKIFVPEQEVTGASITYETDHSIKDHILVGSIHSHANMSAFHSGTDVSDEGKFDGIHLTIGKLGGNEFFDICGSIAVNGLRIPIAPEEYIEGLEVREYTTYNKNMFKPNFMLSEGGEKIYNKTVTSSYGYILNSSDPKVLDFDETWLGKVKEKVIEYNYYMNTGGRGSYIFQNGKLINIDEENKLPYSHQQNLFNLPNGNNTRNNSFVSKSCACHTCIHRNDKIKMKKIKRIPEKECTTNYQFDMSLFDEIGD